MGFHMLPCWRTFKAKGQCSIDVVARHMCVEEDTGIASVAVVVLDLVQDSQRSGDGLGFRLDRGASIINVVSIEFTHVFQQTFILPLSASHQHRSTHGSLGKHP